jgi:hypothetical protein
MPSAQVPAVQDSLEAPLGSRGEAKKEMNMIRHATDGFGNTT